MTASVSEVLPCLTVRSQINNLTPAEFSTKVCQDGIDYSTEGREVIRVHSSAPFVVITKDDDTGVANGKSLVSDRPKYL